MLRSMSSAVAGLKAHQTAMDVIGNNIANVNTYAFKASSTMFRDVMYQTIAAGTAGTDGSVGGTNPSQVGYGSTASAVEVNTGRAGMTSTGDDRDCYIDGEGYYMVANGALTNGVPDGGYLYTRLGDRFQFDSNGYLTDGAGHYICGINNGGGAASDLTKTGTNVDVALKDTSGARTPCAIRYDPADKTAGNGTKAAVTLGSISIGQDGIITAQDDTGNTVTVGRITLSYFSNPAGLTAQGNSMYSSESGNAGEAVVTGPASGSVGSITTGALESSNTDLANEFANMIQFERGFQANTKMITVSDEMLQTLVNMKN